MDGRADKWLAIEDGEVHYHFDEPSFDGDDAAPGFFIKQYDLTMSSERSPENLQDIVLSVEEVRHYRELANISKDWEWTEDSSIGAAGEYVRSAGDGLILIGQDDLEAPHRGCLN